MEVETAKTDFDIDLGFLTLYSSSHVDFQTQNGADPKSNPDLAAQIDKISRQRFAEIVTELMAIKKKEDEKMDAKKLDLQVHEFDKSEYTIALPAPNTILPRFRPLPKPKPLTKFEKYAKEKGM